MPFQRTYVIMLSRVRVMFFICIWNCQIALHVCLFLHTETLHQHVSPFLRCEVKIPVRRSWETLLLGATDCETGCWLKLGVPKKKPWKKLQILVGSRSTLRSFSLRYGKSSILLGFSIINHPFWGIPIFGNTQITHQRCVLCCCDTSTDPFFWRASQPLEQK